ncbi:4'-phosphopantetheinyl transferase superfamily protein [Flavobacterium sp. XS2P39]|uniref:4'-phosphopantetheinyl transferase family protein n=1 Tax=Flavobacterium sp. XS2P39 TaxID=3401725 RepID=UPI003AAC7587
MIGNDIVDLVLAKKESNWRRKGFLNKIFTREEQLLISNAINPELMVWNLWTRKEAAYKIYNRETGVRGYFPLQLECFYENSVLGTVCIKGKKYFTKTKISEDSIHTVAVLNKENLDCVRAIAATDKISKINEIPFVTDSFSKTKKAVSISHHGRFWEAVTL